MGGPQVVCRESPKIRYCRKKIDDFRSFVFLVQANWREITEFAK